MGLLKYINPQDSLHAVKEADPKIRIIVHNGGTITERTAADEQDRKHPNSAKFKAKSGSPSMKKGAATTTPHQERALPPVQQVAVFNTFLLKCPFALAHKTGSGDSSPCECLRNIP
jgi:hypothetical protein